MRNKLLNLFLVFLYIYFVICNFFKHLTDYILGYKKKKSKNEVYLYNNDYMYYFDKKEFDSNKNKIVYCEIKNDKVKYDITKEIRKFSLYFDKDVSFSYFLNYLVNTNSIYNKMENVVVYLNDENFTMKTIKNDEKYTFKDIFS